MNQAAGRRMRDLWRAMAARGETPVSLLLDGASAPVANRHYPQGDVYDFVSHAQFYCHVHRAGERGHIHLFQRAKGMPAGLGRQAGGDANPATHLIAVGFGPDGDAAELFTTNRWVTGEHWRDAQAIAAILPGFRISASGRLAVVADWLGALVAFYAPVIGQLAEERDAALAAWGRARPGVEPLDDGGLEVTSRRAIDPALDVAP